MTTERDVTRRQAAILAGASALVTIAGVVIAVACGAPPGLFDPRDPAGMVEHVAAAGALFRFGLLGWVVAILGDVVRAWALYVFFRSVNASVAVLGAWLMLLHDAIWGASLAGLGVGVDVALGSGAYGALAPETSRALLSVLLQANHFAFQLGLLFFSLHLLANGWLALVSREVPKILGVLVIVAFAGYLVDAGTKLVLSDPPTWIGPAVALPNTIGELALMLWLAFRGGTSRAPTP